MKLPVVLCPLQIECRAAKKALRGRADVVRIGPGRENAARAIREAIESRAPLVVVFGLAGGLRASETAPRIGRVVDKDGRTWDVPVVPPGSEKPVTLLGVDEAVLTTSKKARFGEAYAATLVDMETHVIAEHACASGLPWSVVRGVSDGPDVELPASILEWVDDSGRVRVARALLQSLLDPSVLFAAISSGRRAKPALTHASNRLVELIEAWGSGALGMKESGKPVTFVVGPGKTTDDPRFTNPIERQLGRKSARLNDPPTRSGDRRTSSHD